MSKTTLTCSYKKGEKLHLDDIYDFQAVGGGDWWDPISEGGEEIQITQDVKITIVVVKGGRD